MDERVERHKSIVSIPFALIIALIGITVIALSIYLPWWNMIDNTIGPLETIHLYRSTMKMPLTKEFVWMVRSPILKTAMLTPLLLMILSLAFSVINVIYYKMRKKEVASVLAFTSALASVAAFFVFMSKFEMYMYGTNESVSGGIGYLHWGYGLGWKLSVVSSVLMFIAGLLQWFQTGHFEFEVMFEKETEDT